MIGKTFVDLAAELAAARIERDAALEAHKASQERLSAAGMSVQRLYAACIEMINELAGRPRTGGGDD